MNSAPSSSGRGESGSWTVKIRPPIRSFASRQRTVFPVRASTPAAAKPEAPAPMTTTSESTRAWQQWKKPSESAERKPAKAEQSAKKVRVRVGGPKRAIRFVKAGIAAHKKASKQSA
jgi:hypothetical protein